MRKTIRRSLAATAIAAMSGALLLAVPTGASAADAGPLSSVVNGVNPASTSGTNFDFVQVTAPAPCDAAATRHVLKLVAVTATNPADQTLADAWVGDNLYSPASHSLPGPLTVQSSNSWQAWADTYGQQLVAGNYEFLLRCQNQFGTVIYEEWSGGVTFSSPTAWAANEIESSLVETTTAVTAAPQPVSAGQNVTLTATVSESDAADPSGTVEFFNGATSLGSAPVSSGVATLVGPLAAGTYDITGVYSGDGTFETSTGAAPAGFVVSAAPAAATSTTLVVNPTSGPAYQTVTAQGTVANTDSPSVIPSGTCRFLDGAAVLGTSPVNGSGVCTFSSSSFSGAGHEFTVVFVPADDDLFAPSTSNEVTASYDSPNFLPDEQTVVVTVPVGNLTIFTPYTPANPLDLGDMVLANDGSSFSATADFDKVTVTDTRSGNPGWAASLTRADFVGADPSDTIPAKYSGFENVAPSYIAGNAIQASDVAVTDIPANSSSYVPGPVAFATTTAGNGTGSVDIVADFVLEGVPTSTQPGLYTSTVTFTIA